MTQLPTFSWLESRDSILHKDNLHLWPVIGGNENQTQTRDRHFAGLPILRILPFVTFVYLIQLIDGFFLHFLSFLWMFSNILWNPMTLTSFFSPSWLIQRSMGEGVLYNLVFTEWRHYVSQNEVWGRGCYITLFSPSDVTAFHRIFYKFTNRHFYLPQQIYWI